MSKHFVLLYQLMRKSSGISENELPMTRKLHAALCNIPTFLHYFGPIDKGDTSSWESVHRSMTVGIWELTSKRHQSMNEEMISQCLQLNFSSTNDIISAIASLSIEKYIKLKGPYIPPDYVVMEPISNKAIYDLKIDESDNLYCTVRDLDSILHGSSLTAPSLTQLVKKKFGNQAWNNLKDTETPTSLHILQGICIEGMAILQAS
jgi:hypothetical protein